MIQWRGHLHHAIHSNSIVPTASNVLSQLRVMTLFTSDSYQTTPSRDTVNNKKSKFHFR